MKTVKYKGLTITGDDNQIDDILYHLDHQKIEVKEDGKSFSDLVNSIREFNSKFIPDNLTIEEKTRWTKQFILCMQSELTELLDQMPWKHWKQYNYSNVDDKALKFEIADLFIFLTGIAAIWNMDGKEILEYITNKMNINFERQNKGY